MKNDFYKGLFDNSNDLIQSVSPKGEIQYVNKTWLKTLGYKRSEIKDLNILNIIHPDSLEHCKKVFAQIMSKETSVDVRDITFIKKNRDTIILEGNVSSKFENNKPVYTRGIFRDTTDKAKTEHNLEILNHITQRLNETNDPEDAYAIALDKVVELEYVDITSIYLIDEQTKEAVLQDHRNLPKDYLKRAARIPYPKGITWKVIKSGKILNARDIQKVKQLGNAGKDLGIRSFIGIPIKIDKKTIGVFWLLSIREHYFSKHEVDLLKSIGNQIAISIGRSKNYHELIKINRYDEIISTVVKSVHSSIDLKEVFENTVDALINNIEIITHTGLHIVEDNIAVMKAYRGHPKWFVNIVKRLEYPRGFTWKTINTGKMYYCPDVSKDKAIGPAGRKVGTKSYVSVPITINNKTIGCINVHSNFIDPFNKDELTLLETVTDQIAIAINNAQHAEELKKSQLILSEKIDKLNKKQQLDAITNTILKSVHKSLNVKDIMEHSVNAITRHMPAVENIMIFLVEGDIAILQAHRGFPDWMVKRVREIPYGKGFTWKAISSGKFIYVRDAENDKTIGQAGKELGTKSYIAVPIKLGRKTIGVININSLVKDAFDKDDIEVLKRVPKQLEIAINNANKAKALSDSQNELENSISLLKKKSRYDEIISNITRNVHETIDLGDVMNNAVDSVLSSVDTVNNVSIYLVEGENAVLQAYKGYPKWFINKVSKIPYPKGLTWKTINEGNPRYCPDTEKDKSIGPAGIKVGTKSYVSIPFQYKNENIGCINFNSTHYNAFNKEELDLLEIIATQIQSAINNARHAQEVKQSLHEKEVLLKELHHRVKNNLQIVSSLLSLQSNSISDEYVLSMFEASKSRIDSMALIHEHLYGTDDFERIDLSIYTQNLCNNIRNLSDIDTNKIKLILDVVKIEKNINFAIPFSLMLNELVSNAFKHAFPDNRAGEVNICINNNRKNQMVLKVSDNGIGIPENIDIGNSQSMGMQLISALAQQLYAQVNIKRHNGTVFEFVFSNSDK